MHQEIQAIRFDVEDIGKHVKGSKKRFSWTFGLNGRNHTIILDFSFISSKVKLVVDRKTMLESELPANSSFQHPFTLDGYAINILQQGQSFELRINNKVFSHLYNQAKTNTEFKNYEDEVKDIKVNESTFQNANKTVKLNIGALDGAKKKTKQTAETQNWGNFAGNQMGIPSYFGDSTSSSSQTPSQKKQAKKSKSLLDQEDQSHTNASTQQNKGAENKSGEEVDFFANEKTSTQQSVSASQEQLSNLLNQPPSNDFNTMQNLFATMNVGSSQNPQTHVQQNSLDLLTSASSAQHQPTSQYSTIQMLFATNGQKPSIPQPQTQQPLTLPTLAQGSQGNATSDFYTIGNLFATGAPPGQALNFGTGLNVGSLPQGTSPANNNFNTMQNLFATSNQVPQSVTLGQPASSIENVNLQDFNTLQDLFKTGSGVALSPPSQPTNPPSQQHDPFSILGIPHTLASDKGEAKTNASTPSPNPVMFNTYSGSKTSSAGIDASSFGTMQKGSAGNLDFFQQPLAQPAQPEVPNFSKKKQALDQDLI